MGAWPVQPQPARTAPARPPRQSSAASDPASGKQRDRGPTRPPLREADPRLRADRADVPAREQARAIRAWESGGLDVLGKPGRVREASLGSGSTAGAVMPQNGRLAG